MTENGSSVEAIAIDRLNFAFPPSEILTLKDININLPSGSRCLLIGSNGAGKSTLLQILAGKRMIKGKSAKVLGHDVFFKTPPGVTYLGTDWINNSCVRSDIVVSHFLDSVGGYRHKERRDRLLDILDVDLQWHMHQVSDGERRRVQIVAGLMAPFSLLLLDEVTVDLDVLVRTRLLSFLKEETETRNVTVLYATHIFDGLDNFPSHVCHLQLGTTLDPPMLKWPINFSDKQVEGIPSQALEKMRDPERSGSRLLELALAWLQEDGQERRRLEDLGTPGFRRRGQTGETTDSEVFYKKYDYSH